MKQLRDQLLGDILNDRYRIDAAVARGGMAMVYRGTDLRTGSTVGVKVMHAHLAADQSFVERFEREASNASRLHSPNLIRVTDQGRDGAVVYLVMEYLESVTLRQELKRTGTLTPRQAIVVTDSILAALEAVHGAGMIHRDLKPDNVLLGTDGQIKLTDFGLARAVTTETTTKTLIGTVGYVAPELVTRTGADERTDLYTVGIMLYEMLTGTQPYTDEVPIQVAYRHVHDRVPAPSVLVPGLHSGLDEIVLWLTAPDRADRPDSATTVRAALGELRARLTDRQLDLGAGPAAEASGSVHGRTHATGPSTRSVAAERARAAAQRTSRSTGPQTSASARQIAPGGQVQGSQPRTSAPAAGAHPAREVVETSAPGTAAQPTPVPPAPVRTESPAPTERAQRAPSAPVGEAEVGAAAAGTPTARSEPAAAGEQSGTGAVPSGPIYRRRRKGLVALVAAALVLVLGTWGAIASVAHGRGDEQAPTAEATTTPPMTTVPHIAAGAELTVAQQSLRQVGLRTSTQKRYNAKVAKGRVVDSEPGGGKSVAPGSAVLLVVSDGPKPVKVPDVTGLGQSAAQKKLKKAGLALGKVSRAYSSSVDKDTVISQRTEAGTTLKPGTKISVTVSKGEEPVAVPQVAGMSFKAALGKLTRLGFRVGRDDVYSDTVKKGDVVNSYPRPGSRKDKDDLILLRVSKGKKAEKSKDSATDKKPEKKKPDAKSGKKDEK